MPVTCEIVVTRAIAPTRVGHAWCTGWSTTCLWSHLCSTTPLFNASSAAESGVCSGIRQGQHVDGGQDFGPMRRVEDCGHSSRPSRGSTTRVTANLILFMLIAVLLGTG